MALGKEPREAAPDRVRAHGVRSVLADRSYRQFALTLCLLGMGMSVGMPFVTLFLTKELGTGAARAGLFFLTALAGPAVSMVTGRISDTLPSRAPLLRSSIAWLGLGWLMMGLADTYAIVMLIGLVSFSFIGTVNSQLYAMAREAIVARGESGEGGIIGILRASYSTGWALGPMLGGWLVGLVGYRGLFWLASGVYLMALLSVRRQATPATCQEAEADERRAGSVPGVLLAFAAIASMVNSGDVMKTAYLPLHIVETLERGTLAVGTALTLGVVTEIIAMPIVGRLADRLGAARVMAWAILAGSLTYFVLARSHTMIEIYVVQVLYAFVFAAISGLGISFAQGLAAASPGLASSVYFAGQSLSGPVGSLIGSYAVTVVGIPAMFYLPAIVCGASYVLFWWLGRRSPLTVRT